MKKINILFSMGFLAIILLSSCGKLGPCVNGSGSSISETRTVPTFTKIALDGSANIYITQSNTQSLVIEAQENILKVLETEVSNGKLNIGFKKGVCISKHDPVNIYISLADLSQLSIDGSGDIYGMGHLDLANVSFDIDGSGNINMEDVSANSVDVKISGSGDMKFGSPSTVEHLDVSIDGSGKVKAFSMPANHVKIDIDGSGDCWVNALQTLHVSISGSGTVYYIGSPQISTNISGSGDIINSN